MKPGKKCKRDALTLIKAKGNTSKFTDGVFRLKKRGRYRIHTLFLGIRFDRNEIGTYRISGDTAFLFKCDTNTENGPTGWLLLDSNRTSFTHYTETGRPVIYAISKKRKRSPF